MASTFSPIATQTVSAVSSVSFTSIPSTYTDLRLVFAGSTPAVLLKMRFNNDATDGNYSTTMMWGDGTSPVSARYSVPYLYVIPAGSGVQFNITADIMNYSNATTYKTWLNRENGSDAATTAVVGLWRNTSAINRVDIVTSSSTVTGTFTLYGIASA